MRMLSGLYREGRYACIPPTLNTPLLLKASLTLLFLESSMVGAWPIIEFFLLATGYPTPRCSYKVRTSSLVVLEMYLFTVSSNFLLSIFGWWAG